MGIALEVRHRRILSRREGSVDWQDAMDSFARYAALVEDEGARELLMNMSEAQVLIHESDAAELARIFMRETPPEMVVAVIKPRGGADGRFLDGYIKALTERGRAIAAVADEAEADAYFKRIHAERRAQKRKSGLMGRIRALLGLS